MTLQEFYNKWNGKYADFDGSYPNQCVDLVKFYNRDVVGNKSDVKGNGYQWFDNAPSQFYKKVSSSQKGDIAVWKKEFFSSYGHVAIVWDNGKFFSQNYPLKAPCSLQSIPTTKILGYLRPINLSPMFEQYNEKMVRDYQTGRYALVIRGKKYIIKNIDEVALITWMHRNHIGNFAEPQLDSKTFDSIPNSQGLNF